MSLAWPFNTGFSVDQKESMYRAGGCNDQPVGTNLGVVELDSIYKIITLKTAGKLKGF